jgi:hypothetical protein
LSNVFISAIPALYQLNLMSDDPSKDFPRLITLTIVGGYFGFAFATPLRKFFIIYVARELQLIFPTPSATAMTIRAMHAAATGAEVAKLKMRALSASFGGAMLPRNSLGLALLQLVLHLGPPQQPCDSRRELGLDGGMDSCFHWSRHAGRTEHGNLFLRRLRPRLGYYRSCSRAQQDGVR